MTRQESISFRDQTTGRINDLLIDEDRACAQSQNLLAYLAGALLDYRDEGTQFTPSVVLCDSLQSVLQSFPGPVSHKIGTAPLDPASGPQILKDCAPLSGPNWFMFIERTADGRVNYGVFTYFRRPTAIPLHEGIGIDRTQFCVLLRKVSANTIEMRGAKGSLLTLIFSTVRESTSSGMPIEKFASACCGDVIDERISADFKAYFARLLDAALTSSHGTMLICGKEIDISSIPEMRDAVPVDPALDFQAPFIEFQTTSSADSILSLKRCEELLQGFLRCDGIIVFDTCARIRAYRVFYRPGTGAVTSSTVVGGTRRRAFEGVRQLVGKQLVSVLFRSQDGLTLHHGVNDE